MPTFYCNYYFLLGTWGPLTLGGPLDFAYPAYPIVTPLLVDRHFGRLESGIHQKWDGKSILFHPTLTSETELSIPVVGL